MYIDLLGVLIKFVNVCIYLLGEVVVYLIGYIGKVNVEDLKML